MYGTSGAGDPSACSTPSVMPLMGWSASLAALRVRTGGTWFQMWSWRAVTFETPLTG
jgi:hypothetical protein